jgi:hypothetical protein
VHEFVKAAFTLVCERGHRQVAIDMATQFQELSRPAGFVSACIYGHLELAKSMVSDEDTPKIGDAIDALHYACSNGHLKTAQWVAEHWDFSSQHLRARGRRGIHEACKSGHTNVITWMLTDKNFADNGLDEDDFDTPSVLEHLGRQPGLALWLAVKIPSLRGKIPLVIN